MFDLIKKPNILGIANWIWAISKLKFFCDAYQKKKKKFAMTH